MTRLRLTQHERSRIVAGDYSALRRDQEPKLGEYGCCIVLVWSQPLRISDGQGNAVIISRRPLFWIEVTGWTRKRRGGWAVRFDVVDHRDPRLLLRRTPPTEGDPRPGARKRERVARIRAAERYPHDRTLQVLAYIAECEGLGPERRQPAPTGEAAARESFYTSDLAAAIDDQEAVPRHYTPPDNALLHRRQAQLRQETTRLNLSLGAQLDSLLLDAQRSRVDPEVVRNREKRIRRELELLQRDLVEGRAA